jgi:uncharacterized delta-60 repeat protein
MATEPKLEWVQLLGSSSEEYVHEWTTADDGSIYIIGTTFGNPDGEFNNGKSDVFIAKYNRDGRNVWTKLLGSSEYDNGYGITTGSDGSIYITGHSSGNLDGKINSGYSDAFVAKYTSDGSKAWARLLGSSSSDNGHDITTEDGSIYITGLTNGDLDGISNSGYSDIFIAKYTIDGSKAWTQLLGSYRVDDVNSITTGSDGSVYIIGHTYGDLDGTSNGGYSDIFISKYTKDGRKEWTNMLTSSEHEWVSDITTGSDGSIYIVGHTEGNLDDKSNSGDRDVFIAKYGNDGSKAWTQLLGSSGHEYAIGITTLNDGSIYVSGVTDGDLDGESNNGKSDVFIAKYRSDGSKAWTQLLGSSESDNGKGITIASDGSIYITGETCGNLDDKINSGEDDIFIAKYNSDGSKAWAQLLGSSRHEYAFDIATGADGSIYISGGTAGDLGGNSNSGASDVFIAKYSDINNSIPTGTTAAITSSSEGVFLEGVTLNAPGVTGDSDSDATNPDYVYQWFLNNTAISGAISSTCATTATGAGIYKVAITYTDDQGFTATVDSPEQIVAKIITTPTTPTGTAITINNLAYPETVTTLNGSPDYVQIQKSVSVSLNSISTENWESRYVAQNVGSTRQPGTGQIVSLKGVGKYSFVATAILEATTTINLEPNKNTAFFLHDAYSAFYEGLTLTSDSSGRKSTQRVLNVDTIKMGSAGGTSIVDLTSKDYVTGAVTVYGANQGRSIFWGTSANDTFISGGGDSVIFGGGGANQLTLGTGKDTIQYRSGANATDKVSGFVLGQDKVELWIGKDQVTIEPRFDLVNGSTVMTWGGNQVEFVGVADLNLSNLLPITRTA